MLVAVKQCNVIQMQDWEDIEVVCIKLSNMAVP